jgi:hypothetical protein
MRDKPIGLVSPPAGYTDWLAELKGRIHSAQQRDILARLAHDLREAFPEMKGFSSRNILVMQIETRLLERSGKVVTNFTANLPELQSDLARELLKDPCRYKNARSNTPW